MSLISEINEQPQTLARLLAAQRSNAERIAAAIHARDIDYVFLAARGTSDNAGRYANYLWGALNGIPIALAAPSLFTYYHRPPRLKNALVMGISQSGQSPDIVSVLEEGRRQGCPTLSLTNEPDSPLAAASDFVLDLSAGTELAVAATKTYTCELMAIAMLSAALSSDEGMWRELEKVPGWAQHTLDQNQAVEQYAQRYRYMRQAVVLGRGYNYATAFEWALKLKELTYVEAEPYSSADFQHGPIALIDTGFAAIVINAAGAVSSEVEALLGTIAERGARPVVISNVPSSLALAAAPIPIPAGMPEWLSPMAAIVPGQLLAFHLSRLRGFDPDQPRGLKKVTKTT